MLEGNKDLFSNTKIRTKTGDFHSEINGEALMKSLEEEMNSKFT
jgi:hypothetical protein